MELRRGHTASHQAAALRVRAARPTHRGPGGHGSPLRRLRAPREVWSATAFRALPPGETTRPLANIGTLWTFCRARQTWPVNSPRLPRFGHTALQLPGGSSRTVKGQQNSSVSGRSSGNARRLADLRLRPYSTLAADCTRKVVPALAPATGASALGLRCDRANFRDQSAAPTQTGPRPHGLPRFTPLPGLRAPSPHAPARRSVPPLQPLR